MTTKHTPATPLPDEHKMMADYSAAIYDAEQALQKDVLRYGAAAAETRYEFAIDQARALLRSLGED
jgi:hypothetical protein